MPTSRGASASARRRPTSTASPASTFARSSTGFQRSRSVAMKAANSAGVPPTAIAASPFRRSSAAGSCTALAAAAASLSRFAGAKLAGASRPYHCVISKPGQPCSATVGTSGSWAMRCRRAGGDAAQLAGLDELQDRRRADRGRLQPAREQVGELRAGAAVRHVDDEDAGRHLQVLEREVAGAAVAGRAVVDLARAWPCASATNSLRFFAGRSGWTTYRLGTLASSETGLKSLIGS